MQKAAFLREEGGEGGRGRRPMMIFISNRLKGGRSSLAAQSAQNRQKPPIYRGENLAGLNVAKTISVRLALVGRRLVGSDGEFLRLQHGRSEIEVHHESDSPLTPQGVGYCSSGFCSSIPIRFTQPNTALPKIEVFQDLARLLCSMALAVRWRARNLDVATAPLRRPNGQ